MKSTQEMVGLRIISIADGKQVGFIKDYILNAKGGTLDFFVIDQPSDYFGAKVIAFKDVAGLGEFALTIPDLSVIQDVAQNALTQELLKQDVRVIGTKVLTKKGSLMGEVKEIIVNEENGKITICRSELPNGDMIDIDSEEVITYGKELLIIEKNSTAPNNLEVVNEKLAEAIQEPAQVSEALDDAPNFNLFEQRQLQYFVGKSIDKDVTLDNGEILSAGVPMTEEVINNITTRNTLMEITSHLRKQ